MLDLPNASVAIVVDPNFGDELHRLARRMPVWIVDIPGNRAAVETVRSETDTQTRSAVTTFTVRGDDLSQWCRAILPQIDLHHGEYSQSPAYDSVDVYGSAATVELVKIFSECGFRVTSEGPDRFSATR